MVKVFRRKVEGKKTVEMHWQECGEICGGNSRSTMRKKLSKDGGNWKGSSSNYMVTIQEECFATTIHQKRKGSDW